MKYIAFTFCAVFLFFGLVTKASATTYYVDSTITDTNIGSATPDFTTYDPVTFTIGSGSSSVYKTIADLNAKTFSAGDSILLRKGQIFSTTTLNIKGSGILGNVITWSSFGSGANPSIANSSIRGIRMDGNSYLIIDGIDVSASGSDAFFFNTGGVNSVTSVIIRNLNITTSTTGFNFFAGTPLNTIIQNVTSVGVTTGVSGFSSGTSITDSSFTNGTTGILVGGGSSTTTNFSITNTTISGNSGVGIRVDRIDGLTISGTTVSNNLTEGILFSSVVKGTNINISSSTISGNGNNGAYNGLTISTILGTLSIDGTSFTGNHTNGMIVNAVVDTLSITNSTFSNNLVNGIRLVAGTFTVSGSDFESNGSAGISITASSMTVSDSDFVSNLVGLTMSFSSDAGYSTDITLDNIRVNNNTSNGIEVGKVNGLTISNSIISSNLFYGISFNGVNGLSTNVAVSSTTVSENGSGGSGLYDGLAILYHMGSITIDDSSFDSNNYIGLSIGAVADNFSMTNSTANSNGFIGINILYGTVAISNSDFNYNTGNGVNNEGGTTTLSYVNSNYNHNDGFSWGGGGYMSCDHCSAIENGITGVGSDGDGYTAHGTSTGLIKNSYAGNNKKGAVVFVDTSSIAMYNNVFYHDTNGTLALAYLQGSNHTMYNNSLISKANVGTGILIKTGTTANIYNNIINGFVDGVSVESGATINADYNLINAGTSNYSGMSQPVHDIISISPLFTDLNSNNFSLSNLSPAINAGTDVGLTSDYIGTVVPQGSAPDIGAYEYLLPSAVPTIGTPSAQSVSTIRWNFTDGANNEAGFKIYDNTDTLITSPATENLTYLDETGLSENTQYSGRYAVAYNSAGESAHSSVASSIYTLADVPTNLSSLPSQNSMTLTVDSFPNDTSGQSGYYFSNSTNNTNSGWIQTNTWTETELSCGDTYTYSVKYRNGDGVETDPISITTNTTKCNSSGSRATRKVIVPTTPAPIVTPNPPPNSGPSTYNFGTTTLRNGSRGEAVKELQRFLNAKLNLGLVVDGILGPKTIAVIKKWQKDNGLVADGLVGPKTKAKMNSAH